MKSLLVLKHDPNKPNHYLLLLDGRVIAGSNSIGLMLKEVKRIKGQYRRRKLDLNFENKVFLK